MLITIGKKRWRLVFCPNLANDADCDDPATVNKHIRLAARLRKCPQRLLETIIHECLHAADWSKDEEWIEEISADIARVLWKMGYRQSEEP